MPSPKVGSSLLRRLDSDIVAAQEFARRSNSQYELAIAKGGATIWINIALMTSPAFPQKRILVVDDEPLVCDAVKMMLNIDGHVVETAVNGQEALVLFDSQKFDLVITDLEMPNMKGDELAAAIKARVPDQPVIMITAYAEMLEAAGNPLSDVDCLISKPFLIENLREAIAKITPPETKVGVSV